MNNTFLIILLVVENVIFILCGIIRYKKRQREKYPFLDKRFVDGVINIISMLPDRQLSFSLCMPYVEDNRLVLSLKVSDYGRKLICCTETDQFYWSCLSKEDQSRVIDTAFDHIKKLDEVHHGVLG